MLDQTTLLRVLWICILALAPAAASAYLHPKRTQWVAPALVETVEFGLVEAWPNGALWIDARTHADFIKEHIPSALPLDPQLWEEQLDAVLDAWRADRPTVVYCTGKTCDSAQQVAIRLRQEAQLSKVYVLKGGWDAWKSRH